jgi:tRNA pseudouridine55 synthase
VTVTAHAIDIVDVHGDRVTLKIECSAGFYVRSLAHDLGVRLGTGAHLTALRRTRSGEFTLAGAIALEAIERTPDDAAAAIVPLAGMLPGLATAILTESGERHVAHGRDVGPGDVQELRPSTLLRAGVRLIDRQGRLLGIAERASSSGLLHPSVVLM